LDFLNQEDLKNVDQTHKTMLSAKVFLTDFSFLCELFFDNSKDLTDLINESEKLLNQLKIYLNDIYLLKNSYNVHLDIQNKLQKHYSEHFITLWVRFRKNYIEYKQNIALLKNTCNFINK